MTTLAQAHATFSAGLFYGDLGTDIHFVMEAQHCANKDKAPHFLWQVGVVLISLVRSNEVAVAAVSCAIAVRVGRC